MPDYLIAIAIGPIQDFIAAGRRTRDLWFGSKLLSDISRAAAMAVHHARGELIFPDVSALDNEAGIANIILARLGENTPPPERVQERARHDCEGIWKQAASAALERAGDLVRDQLWREQLDNVIEFYAAWVPLHPDDYRGSRLRVMRLLAGRKLVRNFVQWKGHARVPKSSLDGARESVLIDFEDRSKDLPATQARRLRLARGEHLDIVGLTKRLRSLQGFPSVSRIAADTWLRGLPEPNRARLNQLCEGLAQQDLLIRVPGHVFPYEGAAVYKTRHHELARENADLDEEGRELPPAYLPLTHYIEELERDFGIPDPYVACLVADGDKMGAALSGIDDPKLHKLFSKTLAQFAKEAGTIVHANYGSLVYSGGDDVLAFVPVSTAIQCALQLRDKFKEIVVPHAAGSSLSVGVAIGHSMENMEDLLEFAKAAERHAKEGDEKIEGNLKRDALAVHVHPRGGSPVTVRGRWNEGLPSRLNRWTAAYLDGTLSSKSAYDLKRLLADYKISEIERWDDPLFARAFPQDAARLLKRKATAAQTSRDIRALLDKITGWRSAEAVINELIVARRLAIAVRQPSKLKGVGRVLPLAG